MFPDGLNIPEHEDPKFTIDQLSLIKSFFNLPFCLKNAFARVDILEKLPIMPAFMKLNFNERKKTKHNHIKDACFQKYVLNE